MNKFYLIDKPLNYSSFDVLRVLKKKLNIKKMGHSGTLDPLATGCLLVATGNYTKLIPYLEKDTKTYEFELSLDGTTASFDLAEKIDFLSLEEQKKFKKNLSLEKIQEILQKNFSGKISQIPPKYSALKINGKRAYKLAREGKEVEIKPRIVEIFEIEILDFSYPKLTLKAKVSAGTYIRSIASDLGNLIGCGAYITKLRRTKIGNLDISLAQNLEKFQAGKNISIKKIFENKKFINLEEKILKRINNGLETFYTINGQKKSQEFFVENSGEITNIVEYIAGNKTKKNILKAKRKII